MNSDIMKSLVYWFTCLFLFFYGCSHGSDNTRRTRKPTADTIKLSYAVRFELSDLENYHSITVKNPWQKTEDVKYHYITVKHSKDFTSRPLKGEIIPVPVKRVVCLSTTHIGFIGFIDELKSVVGISGSRYITDTVLLKLIQTGKIADVGYDENINFELIIRLQPDVVLAYGVSGSESGCFQKIRELGFPVILIAEYLEENPLAKLEWIKVFGLLYDKYDIAVKKFDSVANNYNNLKQTVKDLHNKPKVLLGLPWHGVWYISGGESYVARLIADAGGDYLWKDTKFNDSQPMELESIYVNALEADYWLNTGTASCIDEILGIDARFKNLKPLMNRNIYNYNNLMNLSGGNAYFEKGVVEPDMILADLISILHPEMLPSHKLKYYKKLY